MVSKGVLNRRERRESWHSRSLDGHVQKEPRRTSGAAAQETAAATVIGGSHSNESLSLASLLCKLGVALHAMHSFNCQQAVEELSSLPKRHYETGYVLDLVGLSYFESADYKKSELAYNQAWRVEPHRVEGLEYYSSALWHLRRDVELCRLAQQCLQWDRLRPQVWCVVGNCFSLQKEHDAAIKLFKRAIQVDSTFTYAYTLCGHEFVASEKIDKAVAMYENALNLDPRHYNAWWGLGNIYHRQEEHENAKYHFYKALQVNSSNSVLRCYLGMVLSALKQPLLALDSFDQAAQAEPQNGMAYFQKACVLISLERYEEALTDLKKVRCLAPKEACVHFQLGKVYMKLQKDRKALYHFNIAMDLNRDSKDYHTIKTHIEKL
ncbi:CDC27, partial [Symbiodinium pilosum]